MSFIDKYGVTILVSVIASLVTMYFMELLT